MDLRRLLSRFSRKPRGETQVSLPLVPFILDDEDLSRRIEGYLAFVFGAKQTPRMYDALPAIDRAIAMSIGQGWGCNVGFTPAALIDDEGPELVQEFHVMYPPAVHIFRLHVFESRDGGICWMFKEPTPEETKLGQGLGIGIVTAEE